MPSAVPCLAGGVHRETNAAPIEKDYEHTTPFDALAMVLDGELALTIGGTAVTATPGTIVRMPANVPHAVDAKVASRMLLIMLREPKPAT